MNIQPFNLDQAVHIAKARLELFIQERTWEEQRHIATHAKYLRLRLGVSRVVPRPAHSKSEYKRRIAQGDINVTPPSSLS